MMRLSLVKLPVTGIWVERLTFSGSKIMMKTKTMVLVLGTVTFANADSNVDDDENDVLSFGHRFIKNKIEHEYAIAGWALCVMP